MHCSLWRRQWQQLHLRMGSMDINESAHTRRSFVIVTVTPYESARINEAFASKKRPIHTVRQWLRLRLTQASSCVFAQRMNHTQNFRHFCRCRSCCVWTNLNHYELPSPKVLLVMNVLSMQINSLVSQTSLRRGADYRETCIISWCSLRGPDQTIYQVRNRTCWDTKTTCYA